MNVPDDKDDDADTVIATADVQILVHHPTHRTVQARPCHRGCVDNIWFEESWNVVVYSIGFFLVLDI